MGKLHASLRDMLWSRFEFGRRHVLSRESAIPGVRLEISRICYLVSSYQKILRVTKASMVLCLAFYAVRFNGSCTTYESTTRVAERRLLCELACLRRY